MIGQQKALFFLGISGSLQNPEPLTLGKSLKSGPEIVGFHRENRRGQATAFVAGGWAMETGQLLELNVQFPEQRCVG